MRVLLDTTYAARGPSGTATYLERVAVALREEGVEVAEASNRRRRPPAGGGMGSVRNLLADRWWAAVELPRLARAQGADLIHHPLPAHAPAAGRPQVVTVHDLAFERLPGCFDARYRAFARRSHRAAARAADAVVCVSHTTATDVRALWAVAPERIVVALHGPGQEPEPRPETGGRHLLYVGDEEPRKDLPTLLAAHAALREEVHSTPPLVLAGAARASADGVEVVERPGPERLAALYRDAIALVHPSLHEGFGLTPLEAMHAGVPVLAARSPGVVETCGEAALYFEAGSAQSLAGALRRLLSQEPLRIDLAERGRRRATAFSWRQAARAHIDAYTLALESR